MRSGKGLRMRIENALKDSTELLAQGQKWGVNFAKLLDLSYYIHVWKQKTQGKQHNIMYIYVYKSFSVNPVDIRK